MKQHQDSKPWYKKWWVWLIIIVVLSGLGNALGDDQSDTNPTSTTSSEEKSSQQPQKTEEKTEFAIGETVNIDGRKLTVSDPQRNFDTGNQFAQPESGKEFVVVTVTIENGSDREMSYGTYDFKMQDSNGVQQNEAIMAISEGKLNSGSLAAGGTVTGKLAYEVPAGDAGLKLLFENPSLFNNKTITFNL